MRFLGMMVGFVVAASVIGAGPAQENKSGEDDAKKLQGTWSVVAFEQNGKKLSNDEVKIMKVVIEGSTLTIHDGKLMKAEAKFKLDPSKKPKQVDLTMGKDDLFGIYELNGDNFRMCTRDDKRPTEFTPKPKGTPATTTLLVLKRQK